MKKKRTLEADLDAPNKKNTRFGSKTVETALKNAGTVTRRKRPAAAKRKRPR